MAHPAFAEMKASREAKLNSMVGSREAHHELPSEKADRLADGGDVKFSPQGDTGGPVNYPGLTSMGKPATMRSESTEHERADRTDPGPSSVLQNLISPQGAFLRDAISSQKRKIKASTGDYGE